MRILQKSTIGCFLAVRAVETSSQLLPRSSPTRNTPPQLLHAVAMVFWRRKDAAAPSLPVISMPDLSGVTTKLQSIDLKAPVDLLKQQAGNLASVIPLTGGDVQGPMLQGGKMGTGVHIRQVRQQGLCQAAHPMLVTHLDPW
jgi:hypothetical protein